MAKISNKNVYPNVVPSLTDYIVLTDADDGNATKTVTVEALSTLIGQGAISLSDLTDVNTATPTNKNLLIADGVDWESRAFIVSDISATGTADATTFLRGDGSWQVPSGGGGTPAGSDTQIQYNNSGSFGASSDFTWNGDLVRIGTPAGLLGNTGALNGTNVDDFTIYSNAPEQDAAASFSLISVVDVATDSGAEPIIKIKGILDGNNPVVTRPILSAYNNTTKLFELGTNGNWNYQGNKLSNIADPTSAQDAATKAYVDAQSGVTEGSYTPVLSFGGGSVGITYSTQLGYYHEIGNLVTVFIHLVVTNLGSSTGEARISLPYTAKATNPSQTVMEMRLINNSVYSHSRVGNLVAGNNYINPYYEGNLDETAFTATSDITINGQFIKA